MRTENQELSEILASAGNGKKNTKKAPQKKRRGFDPKSAAFAARGAGAGRRNARQMPGRQLQRGGR